MTIPKKINEKKKNRKERKLKRTSKQTTIKKQKQQKHIIGHVNITSGDDIKQLL